MENGGNYPSARRDDDGVYFLNEKWSHAIPKTNGLYFARHRGSKPKDYRGCVWTAVGIVEVKGNRFCWYGGDDNYRTVLEHSELSFIEFWHIPVDKPCVRTITLGGRSE